MFRVTNSAEETEAIAAELARTLRDGACVALDGELGAGKTEFVRGLVVGLGGEARSVSSPTFVLLNMYDTPAMRVFHLDAYRVGAEDFLSIGFPEMLEQSGLVVVEWASRIAPLLPGSAVRVQIRATGESTREIEITVPSCSP